MLFLSTSASRSYTSSTIVLGESRNTDGIDVKCPGISNLHPVAEVGKVLVGTLFLLSHQTVSINSQRNVCGELDSDLPFNTNGEPLCKFERHTKQRPLGNFVETHLSQEVFDARN